jgi:probable HAF family extracellular repeat protein
MYSITDLGDYNFTIPEGNSINDNGQVVGSFVNSSGDYRAFVWDSTNGIQDLGTLRNDRSGISFATDINNQGQVVGYSRITAGASHAFLWDSINGMQDLGTLYPSSIGNPSFAWASMTRDRWWVLPIVPKPITTLSCGKMV